MNRNGRPSSLAAYSAATNKKNPMPEAPAWLTDDARGKWDELSVLLHAEGLLTKIDCDLLAVYCQTWATWRRAVDSLANDGIAIGSRKNPAASVADSTAKLLLNMQREMGLTFSARSKLDLPAPALYKGIAVRDRQKGLPPPDDDKEEFFRAREEEADGHDKGRFFRPLDE